MTTVVVTITIILILHIMTQSYNYEQIHCFGQSENNTVSSGVF